MKKKVELEYRARKLQWGTKDEEEKQEKCQSGGRKVEKKRREGKRRSRRKSQYMGGEDFSPRTI